MRKYYIKKTGRVISEIGILLLFVISSLLFTSLAFADDSPLVESNSDHVGLSRLNDVYLLSRGLLDAGYYRHALPHALKAHQLAVSNNRLSPQIKALITNNLAVVYFRLGQYKQARRLLQQSVRMIQPDQASGQRLSYTPSIIRQLSVLKQNLLRLDLAVNDFQRATLTLQDMLELDRRLYSAKDPVVLHDQYLKLDLAYRRGKRDDLMRQLKKHIQQIPAGRLYNQARAEAGLLRAKINIRAGRFRQATADLHQALVWQANASTELTAELYQQLSYLTAIRGSAAKVDNHDHMNPYHKHHVKMLRQLFGHDHPQAAQAIVDYSNKAHIELSADKINYILEIYARSFGPGHKRTLEIKNHSARMNPFKRQASL